MRTTLALLALLGIAFAAPIVNTSRYKRLVSYEGQKVVSCQAQPTAGPQLLELAEALNLDIWETHASGRVDIRVSTQTEKAVLDFFGAENCRDMIADLEATMQAHEAEILSAKADDDWFENYHTYSEIVEWYENFALNHTDLVTYVDSIGLSFEKRKQPALHITSQVGSNKLKVYFQCQIHAREWISGAVCNFIVNEFVTQYGNDSTITHLLDNLELVVVPFVNPDGYDYTWNGERLWRKNRNTNPGKLCKGVDLNRNYPASWGQGGSSTSACSETYMGAAVESEPETKNTMAYFRKNAPIIGAIDWHSYSELILRPWGDRQTDAPDEVSLKKNGDGMRDAAYAVNRVEYTSEKSIDLYVATGTASDWFYIDDATKTNKGYRAAGFTIELRDTGAHGFVLPPAQIIPNGQEMVAAAKFFLKYNLENPIKAN